MKIGITSDIHLKKGFQERFNALKNILIKIKKNNIKNLIIAGDLFDIESEDYSDFNEISSKFKDISFYVIPGNHDSKIKQRFFSEENVFIIDEVSMRIFDNTKFLFVPYIPDKTMDEVLTIFFNKNEIPERWCLIGHCDYITKKTELNPYEEGVYMPLTWNVLNRFNPSKVFLGHLHKLSEFGKVVYTGSPVSIDITEEGIRRFLIYDTENGKIEYHPVDTDVIYFSHTILVFPFDEINYIKNAVDEMIKGWGIDDDKIDKVILRLKVNGFSYDLKKTKEEILERIKEKGIKIYKDEIEFNVKGVIEKERIKIFKRVKEMIEKTNLDKKFFYCDKDDIIKKAMELIFSYD
uniref:Calcineurin-like phosphoesterase domain-containing protein n=1 Tax=candidate division WOR-3 bacterium TaxID=2052148 RepID=A0A7C4YHE8_UNCW3